MPYDEVAPSGEAIKMGDTNIYRKEGPASGRMPYDEVAPLAKPLKWATLLCAALGENVMDMDKAVLKKELKDFGERGVRFSLDGMPIEPDDTLVDMLLAEDNCTYMRNYVFQGKDIVEINFDKINLI